MKAFFYLIFLAPALPLIGAFWTRWSVLGLTLVAWGALLIGFVMGREDVVRWALMADGFLMGITTGISCHFVSRYRGQRDGKRLEERKIEYEVILAQHQALKADVLNGEREESQLLQIYGVAKSMAEALSWKDMAPRFTTGIQKIFGAYEFLLYSYGEKGGVELLHRRGSWSKMPPVNHHGSERSEFLRPPVILEVVPVLVVPVYATTALGREKRGILYLKSPSQDRSDEDWKRIGDEFGEGLGLTLNKALLFSQMERHSQVDGLTGVLRRQAFMERLEEHIKKAGIFHEPLAIMMVDIDHFKRINDTHGHGAGDAVLSRLGQILKESIYETDLVGRYGGEEFIILLPHALKEGVLRKADVLRRRIQSEKIISGFEKIQLTVSIGVAHFPENGGDLDRLIAASDKALYRAKETGRNKVVAA